MVFLVDAWALAAADPTAAEAIAKAKEAPAAELAARKEAVAADEAEAAAEKVRNSLQPQSLHAICLHRTQQHSKPTHFKRKMGGRMDFAVSHCLFRLHLTRTSVFPWLAEEAQ